MLKVGKTEKMVKTEVVLPMYKKHESQPKRLLSLCLSSMNFVPAFHDGS